MADCDEESKRLPIKSLVLFWESCKNTYGFIFEPTALIMLEETIKRLKEYDEVLK